MDKPAFDIEAAHRHFAAACFNSVWELLDKKDRTPYEDQQMIERCLASIWHWSERPDRTPTTISIGYWQASRVHAVIGNADEARRYGELCLEASRAPGVESFALGYAFEALARAEKVAGNAEKAAEHLARARDTAECIDDEESRQMLEADLDELGR